MKKNSFTKIITIIILAIAAFSLVFGSFIMILSPTTEESTINGEETITINADDNIVTIEWEATKETENNEAEIQEPSNEWEIVLDDSNLEVEILE